MLRFKKHDKGDDRESRSEDKDRRDRRRDDESYRRPRHSSRSPSPPRRRRSRDRRSRSRSPDRRDRRHRSRSPRDRDRRSGRRDDKPKSERSEKKSTTAGDKPKAQAQALRASGRMIEIECNDRLGKKIRVKASPKDTVGDFKKLVAAQIGTESKKIILKKWYKEFKDHITLDDYEIHDGMNIELYYR